MRRAEVIAADSVAQSREEAGDLVLAFEDDARQWNRIHELSEIVAGRVAGRTNAEAVTIFKSNGIAMEDVAAGARVYEMARRAVRGVEIPLWAGKRDALR